MVCVTDGFEQGVNLNPVWVCVVQQHGVVSEFEPVLVTYCDIVFGVPLFFEYGYDVGNHFLFEVDDELLVLCVQIPSHNTTS